MSSTILLRHLPFRLKAFIPLILISFFLISGIPLRVYSAEVNQDTTKVQSDSSKVASTLQRFNLIKENLKPLLTNLLMRTFRAVNVFLRGCYPLEASLNHANRATTSFIQIR